MVLNLQHKRNVKTTHSKFYLDITKSKTKSIADIQDYMTDKAPNSNQVIQWYKEVMKILLMIRDGQLATGYII